MLHAPFKEEKLLGTPRKRQVWIYFIWFEDPSDSVGSIVAPGPSPSVGYQGPRIGQIDNKPRAASRRVDSK